MPLIASLPDCTSLDQNGVILGFHPNSSIEGNIITKKQVADAKARGWLIGDNVFNYYYGSNVHHIHHRTNLSAQTLSSTLLRMATSL
jgi:hypothetical protein